MPRARVTSLALAALVLVVTARVAATSNTAAIGGDVTRTVYFSALDAKGSAVTDLTAADLAVKEGGKDRPIASVRAATEPLQVAIIVDDGGTGAFQGAVAQFLQSAFGHGQFAISVMSPQSTKLVDYTEDANALKGALGQLGQRSRVQPDGEQIIEAVSDAAKELQRRKAARPVILALTTSGETAGSNRAVPALATLQASSAALCVLYVTGLDLGKMLGDGPKQSGGFVERIGGGAAAETALAKMADNLMHQYVLTYSLPEGVKMNEKLQLTTTRKGVTLVAPSRLPDK